MERIFARVTLSLLAALVLSPLCARASLERLSRFLSDTASASADFEQKVYDRGGKLLQQSRGTFAFVRPGRFRWNYVQPYSQLIVGDGSRVWIYDEDLNQVTVKRLDRALGSTPAALLAGGDDAMKAFRLSDDGMKDGLEWVTAEPRDREAGFEKIRIGFGFSGPEVMELADNLGQTTVLRFSDFRRNVKLDPELFRFTPPAGADVIGNAK